MEFERGQEFWLEIKNRLSSAEAGERARGLFIASEIARAHGGTLDVTSAESETRFSFRMPLA
jgi:signal transduction histidine kinase